jgi:opacity protein-like surface antigen
MTHFTRLLAAAAALGCMAAPAAAQYGQPYPPTYPPSGYPPYGGGYPNQPYGGYPGYGGGGVIGNIIDNLIGNRYQVGDRQAIRSCANAAVQRAESDYRPYFGGNLPYAYQGYNGYVRVTAITDVSRRNNGVRVRGLLDTARGGYGNGAYNSDLEFRCDVDYRGYVYNLRISRSRNWR